MLTAVSACEIDMVYVVLALPVPVTVVPLATPDPIRKYTTADWSVIVAVTVSVVVVDDPVRVKIFDVSAKIILVAAKAFDAMVYLSSADPVPV